VAVVTNQLDIARGTTTWSVVKPIHDYMGEHQGLGDIRVCPRDDADGCHCCKPKPGLFLRPPLYDMASSAIVVDRWREIEADPSPADGACGIPFGRPRTGCCRPRAIDRCTSRD
jgi:D-glycero-D-manno-heptose 1,7-bisphosphate phosphatase